MPRNMFDMDKKAAIRKSVLKWERIYKLILDDKPNRCGLCEFVEKYPKAHCPLKGCPCESHLCVPIWSDVKKSVGRLLSTLQDMEK